MGSLSTSEREHVRLVTEALTVALEHPGDADCKALLQAFADMLHALSAAATRHVESVRERV